MHRAGHAKITRTREDAKECGPVAFPALVQEELLLYPVRDVHTGRQACHAHVGGVRLDAKAADAAQAGEERARVVRKGGTRKRVSSAAVRGDGKNAVYEREHVSVRRSTRAESPGKKTDDDQWEAESSRPTETSIVKEK